MPKSTKTITWFKEHHYCKKVIVYQNLKYFLIPSLIYEYLNPNHKILVRGLKKRKYRNSNNYEKIALLLKDSYGYYILIIYLITGIMLLCNF